MLVSGCESGENDNVCQACSAVVAGAESGVERWGQGQSEVCELAGGVGSNTSHSSHLEQGSVVMSAASGDGDSQFWRESESPLGGGEEPVLAGGMLPSWRELLPWSDDTHGAEKDFSCR